jgi:hypothetical protein
MEQEEFMMRLRLAPKLRSTALLLGLVSLIAAPAAHAQVSVSGNFFSIGGGLFQYEVNVTNNTAITLDLIDLDLSDVQPAPLTGPTGFTTVYDSGLSLLTFAEDADPVTPQSFAPGSTVGLFRFQRTGAPVTTATFTALDRENNFTPGTATFAQTAAPEPGTLGLMIFGAAAFMVRRRRMVAR